MALPSSFERDSLLARSMFRFLQASFADSEDVRTRSRCSRIILRTDFLVVVKATVEVKVCANLFRIYPGNVFGAVLDMLLAEAQQTRNAGSVAVVSEFSKKLFFDFISVHQRRLMGSLRQERVRILAIRDAVLRHEPNSNYSIRMEAELKVLYNL
jgi:hypothetical protein